QLRPHLGLRRFRGGNFRLGPTSGINLANPVDAGISLEPATPQPTGEDSSNEFELNLDDSSGSFEVGTPKPSAMLPDSEFEIGPSHSSSDENIALEQHADSEFELSLEPSSDEIPALESPVA